MAPVKAQSERKSGTIQSVERSLRILEVVGSRPNGITLTELAGLLGVNVSTCHHLAGTLLRQNYLDQDLRSKRYTLGPKLLQLKHIAIEQADVYARALPVLAELNRDSTESVHLAVLRHDELVTVAKLSSTNSVRVDREMLRESDAVHCTATGKSILAFMPEEDVHRMLGRVGMRSFTSKTLTDPDALLEELRRVRVQGYATDLEEFEPGVVCVGAPILDHTGAAVASFSVSMPAFRADFARMREVIEMVRTAAQQVSSKMGFAAPEVEPTIS